MSEWPKETWNSVSGCPVYALSDTPYYNLRNGSFPGIKFLPLISYLLTYKKVQQGNSHTEGGGREDFLTSRAFQIKNSKIKVSYFKPHHFGKFLVFHSFWCNTCFTNLNTFPLMPIFIVGRQISCLYFLNFQTCCSLESPLSIENKKHPMEWCIQAIFKVIFSSFHFKKLVWVFVIK